MSLSRRDLIKLGVFGSAAMALPLDRFVNAKSALDNRMPASGLPKPYTRKMRPPRPAVPVSSGVDALGVPWQAYEINQSKVGLDILGNGVLTPMLTYNGQVPGPTIKARRGTQVMVRHCNEISTPLDGLSYTPWTSTHLHGSASLPQYDGYASDITNPLEFKDYRYPNCQPARTLWYHDHGVHHTAENAYSGLVAQYHIFDGSEDVLQIPQGDYDHVMFVHDIMFNKDSTALFSLDNESGMYGDVVCVNGTPWPYMEVEPRKYRFRFLVGNVSRSYKFSFSNQMPVWMISGDGGLHQYAQKVTTWRHIMAERYDVVIDFKPYAGKTINMLNTSPPNNVNYTNTDKVMQFRVGRTVTSTANNMPILDSAAAKNVPANVYSTQIPLSKALPAAQFPQSNTVMDLQLSDAVNPNNPRRLELHRSNSQWKVNNHTWHDIEASDYTLVEANPKVGTTEVWELKNGGGGWHHPLHIHLIDFKIIARNGKAPFNYEACPKDVTFLGEGETVTVLAKFDTIGRYMVHCHNLVHEDHDMMTQFAVVRDQSKPVDAPENNTMYWDDEFAAPYRAAWWQNAGQVSVDPIQADRAKPEPPNLPPMEP